jgi:hypothetical protein
MIIEFGTVSQITKGTSLPPQVYDFPELKFLNTMSRLGE